MSPEPTAVHDGPLTEQFEQLSDPVRRRILVALANRNPRAGDEFTSEDFSVDGEDAERLKTALYHNHLPQLHESGFIDWDSDTNTVTRGPRFDEIAPLVGLLDDHADELPEGWP